MMGDYSACIISEFLENSQTLEVLDLSWNQISSFGGVKIFEGIREGRSCRSLNISYNRLGKSKSFEFVEAVQLAVNEEVLRHLDLSYNSMSKSV